MRTGLIVRVQPGFISEMLRSRALSRLNREQQKADAAEREPLHGRPWLNSELAVRCAEGDCPAVYQADGDGCPRCGSFQAVPIARAINGTEATSGHDA